MVWGVQDWPENSYITQHVYFACQSGSSVCTAGASTSSSEQIPEGLDREITAIWRRWHGGQKASPGGGRMVIWTVPASSKQESSDSEIKRGSVTEQSSQRPAASCQHTGGITGFDQDKLGRISPIGELLIDYEVAIIYCAAERMALKGILYLSLHWCRRKIAPHYLFCNIYLALKVFECRIQQSCHIHSDWGPLKLFSSGF